MSFFFPPVGVISFWVFLGRDEEPDDIARWSFLAAFAGAVVCFIVVIILGATRQTFWHGMGRW